MKNKAENNPLPLPLRQALAGYSKRLLLYIGRQRGLRLSSNLTKTELLEHLAEGLPAPSNLKQSLAGLSPAASAALQAILAAGGVVPLRYLHRRYGPLRPPRQTPGHYNDPTLVDARPLSPLEELRAAALIFEEAASHQIFIPAEVLAWLEPHLTLQPEAAPPAAHQPQPDLSHALEYDLAVLLALLHRHPVRPLHGRWLPPWFLKLWGRQCAIAPHNPAAGGELQTGRRRFLHYLATAAGLLDSPRPAAGEAADDTPRLLTPIPAAWLWLRAAPAQRQERLWSAWISPDPALWQLFRWPGHTWLAGPDQLLAVMGPALLDQPPFKPAQFAASLLARQPQLLGLTPPALFEPEAALRQAIAALLAGPWHWLGVTTPTGDPHYWTLSAQGRRWLAGQFSPPEPESEPPPASYRVSSDLPPEPLAGRLLLSPIGPALPQPAHLALAIDAGQPESGGSQRPVPYAITAATWVDALQRGWAAANLVDSLGRLATPPLTPAQLLRLEQWSALAGQLHIRPAMLLESRSPAILTRLASSRRGRALIRRTHSPRLVEVDPAKLEQLVRRLTRQEGVPPAVTAPLRAARSDGALFSGAEVSQLWLALRVYQSLRQIIDLPIRLPQSLLDRVLSLAQTVDVASAEAAVEQILNDLQQAIQGRAAFPPWPEKGLPEETSRQIIQQALAGGRWLRLTYFAASTNRVTDRIVEPYRLEQRGDTPYLVGFCQHAQSERTFRLDRIRQLQLVDDDNDYGGWEWG